jgi:hypothetical protein
MNPKVRAIIRTNVAPPFMTAISFGIKNLIKAGANI